ncbi:hypothetical protein C8Q80DRAFT_1126851 [Daedaleopsis nitida]|nr:hypothetical protein C8Q80DRAFT_1126851 [Daedaleopsis nitida]
MANIHSLPPDALCLICDCLHQDQDRQSLTSLATTSRVLSRHALARLWQNIPCFAVLAYTLPEDTRTEERVQIEGGAAPGWGAHEIRWLSFTREISSSDLDRFRVYAPFIRAVHTWEGYNPYNESVVVSVTWIKQSLPALGRRSWAMLECVLAPNCLPNLNSIVLSLRSTALMEPVHVFVGHQLREFVLWIPFSYNDYNPIHARSLREKSKERELDWTITPLSNAFARHATDVRTILLAVESFSISASALRHLPDTFASLPQLRTLRLYSKYRAIPISPVSLKCLASLSNLQELEIFVRSGQFLNGVCSAHAPVFFPDLRDMSITTGSVEWCIHFIEQVQSTRISVIDLSVQEDVSATMYARLFAVLARHPSHSTIAVLSLAFDGSCGDTSIEPEALPPDVFSTLFALCNLEIIQLKGRCYAALDNATLAMMADSWPHLVGAELCPMSLLGMSTGGPRATLVGLAPFAWHCPHLTALIAPMQDVSAAEIDGILNRHSPYLYVPVPNGWVSRGSPLIRLGVGSAKIEQSDVVRMAAVLSQWFPRLNSVEFKPERLEPDGSLILGTTEMEERWSAVSDLIPAFATVRAQEQRTQLVAEFTPTSVGSPAGSDVDADA